MAILSVRLSNKTRYLLEAMWERDFEWGGSPRTRGGKRGTT